jgi:hypothetical protein
MLYKLIILTVTILVVAFGLLLSFKKKRDIGVKVSLILLISLVLLQSIYFYIDSNNTKNINASNIHEDKTINKQDMLSPKNVIETVRLQLNEEECKFVNNISYSDIKYVQIDSDDDYEIVIHNKNLERVNFILLDYKDEKYKVIHTNKNIEEYYTMDNNRYLVLVTKFISPGTGVGESKFLVYDNNNASLVFSELKDSVHAKFDSDRIEKYSGNITISNNKLIYYYTESTLDENNKVLQSKNREKEYLLNP